MIEHIIFDLGQVIINQKPIEVDAYLSRIFLQPLDFCKHFYALHKRELVTGQISSLQLIEQFKEMTKNSRPAEELLEEYKKEYLKDYRGINTQLLALVDKLAKNYNVSIFTNTIDVHDQITQGLDIYPHVKYVFKSYVDHIFKPEKEAYEYVAKQLGAQLNECVFVDDLQENIDGAIQAGMGGIVFSNVSNLIADLAKFGVKVQEI